MTLLPVRKRDPRARQWLEIGPWRWEGLSATIMVIMVIYFLGFLAIAVLLALWALL